jgi:hypothetical protein
MMSGIFPRPEKVMCSYGGKESRVFNRYSVGLLLFLFTIAQDALGRCVYDPPIRADVTIAGCVAVTFSSSQSQVDFGSKAASLYKEGASYSGTFLLVTVKSSAFVSREDGRGKGQPWAAGDLKSLFVHRPSDEVCPSKLSEEIVTVTTASRCCDVVPFEGSCLVPLTVPLATLSRAIRLPRGQRGY